MSLPISSTPNQPQKPLKSNKKPLKFKGSQFNSPRKNPTKKPELSLKARNTTEPQFNTPDTSISFTITKPFSTQVLSTKRGTKFTSKWANSSRWETPFSAGPTIRRCSANTRPSKAFFRYTRHFSSPQKLPKSVWPCPKRPLKKKLNPNQNHQNFCP